jgi:hypothetical protein
MAMKNGPDDATGIVWAVRYVFLYIHTCIILIYLPSLGSYYHLSGPDNNAGQL